MGRDPSPSRCSIAGSFSEGIVTAEEVAASSSFPILSPVSCKSLETDALRPDALLPDVAAGYSSPSVSCETIVADAIPGCVDVSAGQSGRGLSSTIVRDNVSNKKEFSPVCRIQSLSSSSFTDRGVSAACGVDGCIGRGVLASRPGSPSPQLEPPSSFYPVHSALPGGSKGKFTASDGTQVVPDSSNFKFPESNFPPLLPSSKSNSLTGLPMSHSLTGLPTEASGVKILSRPSWASLVQDSPAKLLLSYVKPVSSPAVDGRLRVKLPSDVAEKGASVWKNTLVGFFLDKLPFSFVHASAHRLWDKHGLSEVLSNGNGFFFFKFSESAGLNVVLEGGPWHIGGRPIFIKLWTPGMNLSKEGCKRVPIWAHFYNVPLELWTDDGLSYIASVVGKPLYADPITASFKRLNYARICIEINIDDSLPNAIDIELDDGSSLEIQIEYNWIPKKCSVCSEFGHLSKNCKRVSRRVWVPKTSIPPVISSSSGDWKSVTVHGRVKMNKTSPDSKVQHPIPPCVSSHGVISASGLSCSTNAFESLHVEDDAVVHSYGKEESVLSSPTSNALQLHPTKDPTTAVDDPFRSGVGVSSLVDDPIGGSGDPMAGQDPIGIVADDPIDVDDPSGTGAAEDPKFDDPNASSTVATVPLASSVSLVGDSSCSDLSSPCIGCDDSSPSSSPSSTPLLARRLMLIDEVERKLGRKKKDKKKNGSSGNSRGKLSSISK